MSVLLFRLRSVPDDEAQAIRELLREQRVAFYETDAGNWGISMPGIWLQHEQDLEQARSLVQRFQKERAEQARATREAERAAGTGASVLTLLKRRPLMFIGTVAFCLFIIYVSIKPFVELATAPARIE